MRAAGLALLLALGASAACDGSGAGSCVLDGGLHEFGECCLGEADCTSGVCHFFGDGSQLCTLHCVTNEDCPVGSQGRKCNRQGVCRP